MRRRFTTCLLLAVIVTHLFYFNKTNRWLNEHVECPNAAQDRGTPNKGSSTVHSTDLLRNIANATLGFERVFAIGLEDRMDKRDAMTVSTSLTQIDIEWINGVQMSDFPDKAYPAGWEREREKPNEVAAWRAHMNALQKIVSDKISTALLLEDDCDWDVTLKAQLQEFARGTRALQRSEPNPRSPYGDNWRVLWLGNAGTVPQNQSVAYMIPDDPTVRPDDRRAEGWWPDVSEWPEMQQSRFIFDGASGIGSIAYAVTYEAARFILAKLSMEPTNNPFDLSLGGLCEDQYEDFDFHCFTPFPPLLSFWRKAGPGSADSDIVDLDDEWHDAYSPSITYSVMLNANRLSSGAKMAEAQWPEVEPQRIDPAYFQIPRGRLISLDEMKWMSPDALEEDPELEL